jgi:hypothetical protein
MSDSHIPADPEGDNLPHLPEAFGTGGAFVVPESYFEAAGDVLKALGDIPYSDTLPATAEGYFDASAESLSGLSALGEPGSGALQVPGSYFAQNKRFLKSAVAQKTRPGRLLRLVLAPGMTAAAVVAALLLRTPAEEGNDFASLLAALPIDETHLVYFADDEDYYHLWLLGDEITDSDTTMVDTLSAARPETATSDTATQDFSGINTAPGENNTSTKQKAITFDDLTDEEIMDFFFEAGTEGLFDE